MARYIGTIVLCMSVVSAVSAQRPERNRFDTEEDAQRDTYGQTPRGQGATAGPGGPVSPVGPSGPGGPMAPPAVPMFDAIDADGDGAITMRELRKAVAALRELDVDEDGNLTREEALGPLFTAPPVVPGGDPNVAIDRMMQGDRDGDGKLSPNELPPQVAQMLQNADTNGDGALDRAELAAAMRNAGPRFGGGPGQFGGPGVDPRQGPQLMQYDQNGDGQLSPNEVPRQLRGMLQGSDQNGNGVLDREEIDVINQRMNERVRGGRRFPPGFEPGQEGAERNRRGQ